MDWASVGLFLGGVLGVAAIKILQEYFERKLREENKAKIAAAESKVEKEPEKAKPAWDLARATLEAYFNRNLSQINSIFWLSVVVMFLGFGIIVWGVLQAINRPEEIK